MSVKDLSDNITTKFLTVDQGSLKEKTVSKWTRLWRWLGSALGLCDSTIVSCAKKSLKAIEQAHSLSLTKAAVSLKGREINYIIAIFSQVQGYQDKKDLAQEYQRKIAEIELVPLGWSSLANELAIELPVDPKYKPFLCHLAEQYQISGKDAYKICAKALVESAHELNGLPFNFDKENFEQIYLYLCAYTDQYSEFEMLSKDQLLKYLSFVSQACTEDHFNKSWDNELFKNFLKLIGKAYQLEILKNLKSQAKGIADLDKHTKEVCLAVAAAGDKLDILEWFKQEGHNFKPFNEENCSIITQAAANGQLEVLKWLKAEGSDLNLYKSPNGLSCLELTTRYGHLNILEWFKQEGHDFKPLDEENSSIITQAVTNGRLEVLKWLEAERADLIGYKSAKGLSCLGVAVSGGHLNILKWFKQWYNNESIIYEATFLGQLDVLKWLKANGVDLYRCKYPNGHSCLELASIYGYLNILEWFKLDGHNFKVLNKENRSLIYQATFSGQLEVLKWLKAEGTDLNIYKSNYGLSCLAIASTLGHLNILEWFKQQGHNFKPLNKENRPIISQAACLGQLEVLKWLKAEGADFQTKIVDIYGPTSNAALYHQPEVLSWMKQEGIINDHAIDVTLAKSILTKANLAKGMRINPSNYKKKWLDTVKWLDTNLAIVQTSSFKSEYINYVKILLKTAHDLKADSPEFDYIKWVLCEKKLPFPSNLLSKLPDELRAMIISQPNNLFKAY